MTVTSIPRSSTPVEPANPDNPSANTGGGASADGFASVLAGVSDRDAERPQPPERTPTTSKTASEEARDRGATESREPADRGSEPVPGTKIPPKRAATEPASTAPPAHDPNSPTDPVTAALRAALAAAAPHDPHVEVVAATVTAEGPAVATTGTAPTAGVHDPAAAPAAATETAATETAAESLAAAAANPPGPKANAAGAPETARPTVPPAAADDHATPGPAPVAAAETAPVAPRTAPVGPLPTPSASAVANAAVTAVAAAPVAATAPARPAPAASTRAVADNAAIGAAGAAVDRAPSTEAPTAAAAPAAPAAAPAPPPVAQLAAVIRPLQHTGDGNYELRIEMRPAELGRVDMRVELRDGVLHASIHTEHAQTADLVRNALDDLRSRLEADGLRSGRLTVDSQGTGDARRDAPDTNADRIADESDPIAAAVAAAAATTTTSESLLDVRI